MGRASPCGALPQLLGPFSGSQKWQGSQKNETRFVISTGLLSSARLQSQGHAWAPCGQEHGFHIPPKPFSQHFTPVSQGAASSSRLGNRSDLFVLCRAHWVDLGWAFLSFVCQ